MLRFDEGPLWLGLFIGLSRVLKALALEEVWGGEATVCGALALVCACGLARARLSVRSAAWSRS
jgi:hypothetical protein